ncbi:hypothetical protein BHM03_00040203 [Ensete ventricosum]|nr:hypothetical protein BHM03_00040203 [Ensete ventricosum]
MDKACREFVESLPKGSEACREFVGILPKVSEACWEFVGSLPKLIESLPGWRWEFAGRRLRDLLEDRRRLSKACREL